VSHDLSSMHVLLVVISVSDCFNSELFLRCYGKVPEIQAKAQREIDVVVGQDRLPDFSDQPRLVYIHAVMLECLRWHPVAPLGERNP
jgi:hypothetical protein